MAAQPSKPVSIRLPERVLDRISLQAAKANKSLAEFLRDLIFQQLEKEAEDDRLAALESRIIVRIEQAELSLSQSINSLVAEAE